MMNTKVTLNKFLILLLTIGIFSCTKERDIQESDFIDLMEQGVVSRINIVDSEYVEIKLDKWKLAQSTWADKYKSDETYKVVFDSSGDPTLRLNEIQKGFSRKDTIHYGYRTNSNLTSWLLIWGIPFFIAGTILIMVIVLPLILIFKMRGKVKRLEARIKELEK